MRELTEREQGFALIWALTLVYSCSSAQFSGEVAANRPQVKQASAGRGSDDVVMSPPLTPDQAGAQPVDKRTSGDAALSSTEKQPLDPGGEPWTDIEKWLPPEPKEVPPRPSDDPSIDSMPPMTPPIVNTAPPPEPPASQAPPPVEPPMVSMPPEPPVPAPPVVAKEPPAVVLKPCSTVYTVPATANPYFAGSPVGSSLTYKITSYDPPAPTDTAPGNSPVLVAPIEDCIVPGKSLYFSVAGTITFSRVDPPTDANGNLNQIVRHQKGAQFGKSDIVAPINSLIGVFTGESDPASQLAPSPLDFSSQVARDYVTLSPTLGQVFFIGTGINSTGKLRKVIVPQGATRLYFAVMDIYQWNNNSGSLSGAIMTE